MSTTISNRRVALKRLITKCKIDKLRSALQQLAELTDSALEDKVLQDVELGSDTSDLNFAMLSMMTDTSAIEVEELLAGRMTFHNDRLIASSRRVLQTFLLVMVQVDEEQSNFVAIVHLVTQADQPDVYYKFWRDDATYNKIFCAFLAKAMLREPLLWNLSDIIMIQPEIYRKSIGLKSNDAHIDKICDLAQRYIDIPKLFLWDVYDKVVGESGMTAEELFEVCKQEVCDILDINLVLIERDWEHGNTASIMKWVSSIIQKLKQDNGRGAMHNFTKQINDDKTQLSRIWKEAKNTTGLLPDMTKQSVLALFKDKGREMLPQIVNHFISTLDNNNELSKMMKDQLKALQSKFSDMLGNR